MIQLQKQQFTICYTKVKNKYEDIIMRSREGLSIIFNTSSTAETATVKLQKSPVGTFLLRESSVPGLLTVSWHKAQNKIVHVRFGLAVIDKGVLGWLEVPGGADKAKAEDFMKTARNAVNHLSDQPESIRNLIWLLNSYGLDLQRLMLPTADECSQSSGYCAYGSAYFQQQFDEFKHSQKDPYHPK